ncbi:MAG: cation diffusion facilitator family transporter [Candidatus Lokiarchaeota archaeon]|nr:cation diffusion facilitator family transporter [Candidatus Lokiarchaeota archaeon]
MDVKIKYGIIAFIIILIQSSLKTAGVLITGSLSFLSETVDTLTDILFVSLTIYSLYVSQKPPDFEHMYGHSKIDSLGGLVQGVILVNIYCVLIFVAIQTILTSSFGIINPDLGFLILIISFIINLVFSRILIWQGKKQNSLSLKIQGLNLFQDSLRALIVIINFVLTLVFSIQFLDPYFSIALSILIIISSIHLSTEGIKDLIDANPINSLIIEEIKLNVFNLEHVNGVEEIKVRISGNTLFLEIRLSVEDHISVVHANEITKGIRALSRKFFPSYNVESVVEMNPLSGESSLGENIVNLLYTMKSEFKEISDFKDLNIFRIENDYFLSLAIIVDDGLSLEEAHELSNLFERQLQEQVPFISRIITHIESQSMLKNSLTDHLVCTPLEPEKKKEIQTSLESLLKSIPEVKGYHGLEFWAALDFCVLELHVFFNGALNITRVHTLITEVEQQIKNTLNIENLAEVILHSEPIEGRSEGIIF